VHFANFFLELDMIARCEGAETTHVFMSPVNVTSCEPCLVTRQQKLFSSVPDVLGQFGISTKLPTTVASKPGKSLSELAVTDQL
jgi:hypothetical protein